jgi:hypothetical protein
MANSVIGALRVMLGMDTAEFEEGATRAQRSAKRFERDMQKLGGKLQRIGTGMSIALTAPLAAFGASSFKAASDAAELQSAFNQTFGEMAGAMDQWAEQTGNAMGRSTQSMQRLANTFGIFFNQAAPTRAEAAEMSKTFAVLAQDLASFYNVTEEDALAKLRSGLAGESEPLRDFGVFLSEAAVNAKALELGLTGANNPLSEQEKIMARYAIILEQTANAQGDVARTSDGTANQMRKAQAAFEELQVVVGTKLLPVLTPLIEKLGAALEWFTSLPEPVQNFGLAVAAIAAALGPVLTALGALVQIAPAIVSAIGIIRVAALALMTNPVLLGFGVAITAIFLAWQHWDKIEPILRRLYQGVEKWLGKNLTRVLNTVLNPIGAVTDAFKKMYVAVVGNSYVPDMVTEIGQHMNRLQAEMVDPATRATESVTDAARKMAGDVAALLDRLFPEIAEARRQMEDLALIDKAGLDDRTRAEARRRALGLGEARVSDSVTNQGPLAEAEKVAEAADKIAREMAGLGDRTEVQTVRIAETFQQMVDRSLGALRKLADGIKGGDFFSILEGVIGLGTTLGGFGVFGKRVQANLQNTPGFATGGAMKLGGLSGIDRNVLSLNGSPIARVSAGETMQINPANDARMGALKISVTMDESTGALGAFVRNEAGQVVASAAPSIAAAGAGQAVGRIRQMQSRALS